MKKKNLTVTGRSVGPHVNMQNIPGSLADKLSKAFEGIPPRRRHHYSIRSSQVNLYTREKEAPRVYYADFYHEAVAFISNFRTFGSIQAHNGGSEWKIEI